MDTPLRSLFLKNHGPEPALTLSEEAERRLRNVPHLAMKNLTCNHKGAVLVLEGCLPTYYLKQVAQEAVAALAGVERIDNQIEVTLPIYRTRRA
jgi:hypothetical protein